MEVRFRVGARLRVRLRARAMVTAGRVGPRGESDGES